jgi:hypothetical protein
MSYKIKLSITVPTLREAKLVLERLKNSVNSNFGEYEINLKKVQQIIPKDKKEVNIL